MCMYVWMYLCVYVCFLYQGVFVIPGDPRALVKNNIPSTGDEITEFGSAIVLNCTTPSCYPIELGSLQKHVRLLSSNVTLSLWNVTLAVHFGGEKEQMVNMFHDLEIFFPRIRYSELVSQVIADNNFEFRITRFKNVSHPITIPFVPIA